jgi:hypothetical protein
MMTILFLKTLLDLDPFHIALYFISQDSSHGFHFLTHSFPKLALKIFHNFTGFVIVNFAYFRAVGEEILSRFGKPRPYE